MFTANVANVCSPGEFDSADNSSGSRVPIRMPYKLPLGGLPAWRQIGVIISTATEWQVPNAQRADDPRNGERQVSATAVVEASGLTSRTQRLQPFSQ
jgi:hypothetical protein